MADAILDHPYDIQNDIINSIRSIISEKRDETIKYLKEQINDRNLMIEEIQAANNNL